MKKSAAESICGLIWDVLMICGSIYLYGWQGWSGWWVVLGFILAVLRNADPSRVKA
jgi:hypothetical protein